MLLPDQQRAALEDLAARTELSLSEHIRRALDEYLKRHKQTGKPAATEKAR